MRTPTNNLVVKLFLVAAGSKHCLGWSSQEPNRRLEKFSKIQPNKYNDEGLLYGIRKPVRSTMRSWIIFDVVGGGRCDFIGEINNDSHPNKKSRMQKKTRTENWERGDWLSYKETYKHIWGSDSEINPSRRVATNSEADLSQKTICWERKQIGRGMLHTVAQETRIKESVKKNMRREMIV